MSCDYRRKLELYADGEISASEHQEISAHLSSCPDCGGFLVQLLEMKKTVRIAGHRYSAPMELRTALAQKLRPEKVPGMFWRWGLVASSFAISAMAILFFLPRSERHDPLMSEVVDQHVTTLASLNPMDVVSTDRQTVKPWFEGKLPFSFNLPEVGESSPYKLVGGKVAYLRQDPSAEVVYEVGKHKISVFIFREGSGGPELVREHGLPFTVEHWNEGSVRFCLVTDSNQDDADKLAAMLHEANRR
jgi:anti-sigma factor RsiW